MEQGRSRRPKTLGRPEAQSGVKASAHALAPEHEKNRTLVGEWAMVGTCYHLMDVLPQVAKLSKSLRVGVCRRHRAPPAHCTHNRRTYTAVTHAQTGQLAVRAHHKYVVTVMHDLLLLQAEIDSLPLI